MNGLERPTTPSRDDVSSGVPRTSAAPAPRWEPCACGGVIVVRAFEAPVDALVLHQDTARHLKWRIARLEDGVQ